MARQPVKVTYAHKRGRVKATATLASSPLQDLPPDHDDITRSEMSRRMLKRSRRISRENDDQVPLNNRAVKRARQTVQVSQPDAFTVGAGVNTFQTPFPSDEYIHPSSVTRPLEPEKLSPVPHTRRTLLRASSRNLKENSMSHPLASPFHSRPSSPYYLPISKAKAPSYRVHLHSKSRTLPGALEKNDNTNTRRILSRKDSIVSINNGKLSRQVSLNDSKLSRKDATSSLNELARNSPSKSQRYTSNFNPSYMLSHIAQQDWIPPPKSLPIHAGNCGPDPELLIRPNPTDGSSTSPCRIDRAQFVSTPQHRLSGNRTGLQAPKSPSRIAFLTLSPRGARDEDFEMANAEVPKIHIPGNSIISSSGSFTLKTGLHAPDVDDYNDSAGSAPMSISTDVLHQKISMGAYTVPLVSSPFPAPDVANTGPRHNISLDQDVMPLPGTSPLVSPAPPVGSTRTAIGTRSVVFPESSPPPDSLRSAARKAGDHIALPPPPTRCCGSSGSSNMHASSQADLIQDMLLLGLGGKNHDAGVQGTQLPTRTRALDSRAGVHSKKMSTTKQTQNRAGITRASDFARHVTSGTTVPVLTYLTATTARPTGSLHGRTRSGTVVGPNSKLAVKRKPVVQVTKRDASSGSVDDLAVLKVHEGRGPWSTEDLNHDLAHGWEGKRGKEKIVHDEIMSDDPLLIVGPWKDDDWS